MRALHPVFLLLTILGSTSAGGQTTTPRPATVPAIYLQHVGDSDKPIFPQVFAAALVPVAELERVLGKDEARYAKLIVLSAGDFQRATTAVSRQLAASENEPGPEDRPYGTFRVTVVRSNSEVSRVVNSNRAISILDAVERGVQSNKQDLSRQILPLRQRLSGGTAR